MNFPLFVFLFLCIVGCAQNAIEPKSSGIEITFLQIDEPNNVIAVHCTVTNTHCLEQLGAGKAHWRFDIEQQDAVLKDIIIKRSEQVSDNNFVLHIQIPLAISIYRMQKMGFVLSYIAEEQTIELKKEAVLGSSLKHFDLRPYTTANTANHILWIFLIVLFLSLVLWLITPVARKYVFKKHHIKKIKTGADEEKPQLDPFTFVTMQPGDDVVILEDQMMLLSSWKKIRQISDPSLTEKHGLFFAEKLEGTFLNPKTKNLKLINKAWYGLLGIAVGWILNIGLTTVGMQWYSETFFGVFNGDSLQVATVIARDTLLGFSLGLSFSLAMAISDENNKEEQFSKRHFLLKIFLRTLIITFAFFIQAVMASYWIQDFYWSAWGSWSLIAIAFINPFTPKADFKKEIFLAFLTGFATAIFYLVLSTNTALNVVGVSLPLLFGIFFLNGLLAYFKRITISATDKRIALKSYLKSQTKRLLKQRRKREERAEDEVKEAIEQEVKEEVAIPKEELEFEETT